MRSFQRIIWWTILISLTMAGVVLASVDDNGQPNDPLTNERANACYAGGSMEGKCDTDWEWTCGWYAIRYEQGLLNRDAMPGFCSSLLSTSEADTQPTQPAPTATPTPDPFTVTAVSCAQVDQNGPDPGGLLWEVDFLYQNEPPETTFLETNQTNFIFLTDPTPSILTAITGDPQDVTVTVEAWGQVNGAQRMLATDTDTITCQTPG